MLTIRGCIIKHYRFIIYVKRTDNAVSWCLFYCQPRSLTWTNTPAYYEPVMYLHYRPLVPHSQHSIFFVTYELDQRVRGFVIVKTFQPSVMQYSSLLGQFVSYEKNEVL
jgi:hypothetical protein